MRQAQLQTPEEIGKQAVILLAPWFRALIPKLEGIQEESPDGFVKTAASRVSPQPYCIRISGDGAS